MMRRIAISVAALAAVLVLLLLLAVWGVGKGGFGEDQYAGQIADRPIPAELVTARQRARDEARQRIARGGPEAETPRQILFGDLHVHTTFSNDAFFFSLPLMQGEGAHPPADACDFARHCSALDFWSINDHAELITPRQWRETKESIRQCNAVAGDPENPDLVSFLGWEWSNMGDTPETHFGHKNVIVRDLAEDSVPARPIGATRGVLTRLVLDQPMAFRLGLAWVESEWLDRYVDFNRYAAEAGSVSICEEGVPPRDLPINCMEYAATPDVLFAKLALWGGASLVIPHGLSWGIHAPTNSDLIHQLRRGWHDPKRQRFVEVYSGHGTSERFGDFEHVGRGAAGEASCPKPSEDFTPCCWRAGELIRERCEDPSDAACEERVRRARQTFAEMGRDPRRFLTVSGTEAEDWLDCGQLRDFLPALDYRPRMSAQYALARRGFGEDGEPTAMRLGLAGASDNHYARAGTGYKEFARRGMTDARGARSDLGERFATEAPEPSPEPLSLAELRELFILTPSPGTERGNSYLYTGGLTAVHTTGRDREAVWAALGRREIYATSGDRMLLWFDLLNDEGGLRPMGSEVQLTHTPRFRVRAVGALEQLPGCPDYAVDALDSERLERLCKGECYNPGDRRKLITRIEVIRIRPQQRPDEPVASLIEDPWFRFDCPPDPAGCSFEFEDPSYPATGRETIYYARAIEAPSPAINGELLRCDYDEDGRCIRTRPCFASGPKEAEDDCLGMIEERAWSSPIFLRP